MREIRYRQWIKSTKSFHYWGYIIEHEHIDIYGRYFQSPLGPMDNDKRESDQYTGLKDKDGKEIYERDIIELTDIDSAEPDVFVVSWEKPGYFTLKPFLDPEGYVPTLGYFTDKDLNDDYYSLKIIGNRHENPELVGDKKRTLN